MLLALILGCTTAETLTVPLCLLDTPSPTVSDIQVGETLTVTTSPVSTLWDSTLYIGAARAELTSLDRTDCDTCDSCRETQSCSGCGACDECALSCASCNESLSAIVPDVAEGPQSITVINHYGRSADGHVVVHAAADSGLDSASDSASP